MFVTKKEEPFDIIPAITETGKIMSLEKGDLLNGRYRISEILGHGGMGAVYRAVDESLGVEVAVKENLFVTEDYARQFRLEAVILASLRHTNLPRVTDHFVVRSEGQYLVMDFIPGEDLRQLLERQGSIPEAEVIRIGTAICDALAYLHTRTPPVLHRDIKLGNIKVGPDGHVCLVDFGLAKMANVDEMTMTGARAMTPGYSPPEQYGTARTDARSDIYALGATLYAALTGFIPEDSLARVMDGLTLTPIRERNRNVSERLASVIEKAMEVQPANRYQSAEEFKQALSGTMDETTDTQDAPSTYQFTPIESRPAQSPPAITSEAEEPNFTAPHRKRSKAGAWFFVLFLFALAGSGYFFYTNPEFAPEPLRPYMATPTFTPTFTQQPTVTLSPEVIATETPLPATATLTATATLKPSATPSPQPTATLAVVTEPAATNTQPPTGTTVTGTASVAQGESPTLQPGLQLVYASVQGNFSQLFLVDINNPQPEQLTNLPNGACQPSWSPDGTKIVFVSPCTNKASSYDTGALFIFDLASKKDSVLWDDESGNFAPAWSPDGTTIAFVSNRGGSLQLYLVSSDGKNTTRLSVADATLQPFQPVWSPDSKTIYFTANRFGLAQVWKIGVDGTAPAQFVRTGGGNWDLAPSFSPDAKSIYFSQSNKDGSSPAWLMRWTVGSDSLPERVTVDAPVMDIDVSPDGQFIAYEGADGSNQDIYLLNLTNNAVTFLTTSDTVDFDPAWRPLK